MTLRFTVDRNTDPSNDHAVGVHSNSADSPEDFSFDLLFSNGEDYRVILGGVRSHLSSNGRTDYDNREESEFNFMGESAYTGISNVRGVDGIQFTCVELQAGLVVDSFVFIVDDVSVPAGASVEIALYGDSTGPSGSKLATTGLVSGGSLVSGRNKISAISTYDIEQSGFYWIGFSNLVSNANKISVVTTFGQVHSKLMGGMFVFDKSASGPGQPDPVSTDDVAESTEGVIFVAVVGRS